MTLYLGENLISGVAYPTEPTRNVGQIIESILPLTDAGLHLLDGALINGSGIYADFVTKIEQIYNSTTAKYSNVNKYGSVVDTNGVLTNITTNNYVTVPTTFNPSTNTWEIVVKFKRTNSTAGTTAGGGYSWAVNIDISTGHLELYISSNNSSWDVSSGTQGTTVIQNDIDYWYKVSFTGTSYILYLSTTGEFNGEEIAEVTITSSSNIYGGNTTCLGKWEVSQTTNAYTGIIDLNGCYININNSRWWTGREVSGFTDETTWQTTVNTYGVCGKFVYDSENNTVRLPKITGIIEGTTDISALGDLVEAGLPIHTHTRGTMNITGSFLNGHYIVDGSGAFYDAGAGGTKEYGSVADDRRVGFEASRSWTGSTSNPNYTNTNIQNSSTVQPQTIKVLYYIVIATSTKTDIEVDIDEIATDLNGKADTDLSNVPASKGILTESYVNGTSWYRVYSDGWCEQGGSSVLSAIDWVTVNFIKSFVDTNYTFIVSQGTTGRQAVNTAIITSKINASSAEWTLYNSTGTAQWYACGHIR